VEDGKVKRSSGTAATVHDRVLRMRKWRLAEYEKMMVTGYIRSCPVCGYKGEFVPVGEPPRLDGMCPSCRCRERHRLFRLWLDREKRIDKTKSVLHFAPEPFLRSHIRSLSGRYMTADLMAEKADVKLDIEGLDLPDGSFDVIIAHQILEHVDHLKALAECFRCLSPGGLMITTTPIIEAWEKTYYNPAARSKRDRLLHFGQHDHTRFFGRDLKVHMRAAGFALTEYVAAEPDVSEFALIRGEALFLLEKPISETGRPTTAPRKTKKG
jgi:SAM-dependent methyltransferase